MLKLRLIRVGRRNDPYFRIVAQDIRRAPKGKYTELLGSYAPLQKKRTILKERVLYWLSQGAAPTDTVWNMLVSEGIVNGKKKSVHAKTKKTKETTTANESEEKSVGA